MIAFNTYCSHPSSVSAFVLYFVELDEGETRFIPLLNDKESISDHFLGRCTTTIRNHPTTKCSIVDTKNGFLFEFLGQLGRFSHMIT